MEYPQLYYKAEPGRTHRAFGGIGVSRVADIMSQTISLETYAVGAWSASKAEKEFLAGPSRPLS